ncbi:hypothetical protein MXB_2093 [Myxobolus squamalis]|nr:hypothetical protein MXB_2093 [Myxobolus squamalis]
MLVVPILHRIDTALVQFVNFGIADALAAFKNSERAAIHLQAGLMWIDDLSKDLDPESSDKVKKFKEESRSHLQELNTTASAKFSLVLTSRDLILAKEMKVYLNLLKDHFCKSHQEFKQFSTEFSGPAYYKFDVLEPILGPNNGADSSNLKKYQKHSSFETESFEKFSLTLINQENDVELIETQVPENLGNNDLEDFFNKSEAESQKDESGMIFFECEQPIQEKELIDLSLSEEKATDNTYLSERMPENSLNSRSTDKDLSLLNLEFDDLVKCFETPSEFDNLALKQTKKYQTLNDLATKLDALDVNKNIECLFDQKEEKC